MNYQLRLAQRDDLQIIVSIYNDTIASRQVTADVSPVTEAERIPWFEAHQQVTRPLYVVTQAKRVIGWFSLSDFYGRPAYNGFAEVSIYLDPQVRGQGIGRQLLQDIEPIALKCGVRDLLGIIFSHNHVSIKLFASQGYQHWGELPYVAKMDESEYSVTLMGKRLGPK